MMGTEDVPAAASTPEAWWYWGGPREEHSTEPVVKTVPYSALQGYSWCARAVLPHVEAQLLVALFSRVDSKTWRWPPKPGARGGSSLFELAEATGYSVRHARRGLRALEARGVLITYDCRPHRNEYQIVPEVLRQLGEKGRADVKEAVQANREARADQEARADAHLDRVTPPASSGGTAPANDSPPPAIATEVALPRWARRVKRRNGMTPELAARLVRAVWRAAGEQGLWSNEGCNRRAVLRAWRDMGEPSVEAWEAMLASLSTAVREGRLRGQLQRGWRWSTRGMLELVRDSTARHIAANPPTEPVSTVEVVERSGGVPEGRPAGERLLPGPASLAGRPPHGPEPWRAALDLLRERLEGVGDIWLSPIVREGVDEHGLTVVRVPDAAWASQLATWADALVLAAGGPVRLVWGG